MTNIGDLLGDAANKLLQSSINIGDVHLLRLDQTNGITPKNDDTTRNKFFIVLGFDNEGNVIGGLVINSKINYNLPSTVTDYQLPITVKQCPFLLTNCFLLQTTTEHIGVVLYMMGKIPWLYHSP